MSQQDIQNVHVGSAPQIVVTVEENVSSDSDIKTAIKLRCVIAQSVPGLHPVEDVHSQYDHAKILEEHLRQDLVRSLTTSLRLPVPVETIFPPEEVETFVQRLKIAMLAETRPEIKGLLSKTEVFIFGVSAATYYTQDYKDVYVEKSRSANFAPVYGELLYCVNAVDPDVGKPRSVNAAYTKLIGDTDVSSCRTLN